jgi:hypothetical protein
VSQRLLGRSRQRWNDTIKIVGLEGGRRTGLVGLAQDRGRWLALAYVAMNFQVP